MQQQTIGQLVATNYRTAAVFKKYDIDFCCNGNRTIKEAIKTTQIDEVKLLSELAGINDQSRNEDIDFKSWPLDLLIDYIEKKHHRYVSEQIPVLTAYLAKINKVHGHKHNELAEIEVLFQGCAAELSSHMKKEEKILFPLIKNMADGSRNASVQNPIKMMMHEHDAEGNRFRRIKMLSDNYNPPADACGTYKVAFALLKEFEEDLHLHIHIENNILFPRAVKLEEEINMLS
ncbi:MAG: iron-sulfur cluster repair di-iron protein [Pedobacter sp.]|nr:MAG: iron-sulfur cluster repair di-iron protein [Pedobacter sp.]